MLTLKFVRINTDCWIFSAFRGYLYVSVVAATGSRTLASVKHEISQALPSLLEEIRTSKDAKAFRSFAFPPSSDSPRNANLRSSRKPSSRFDSRK